MKNKFELLVKILEKYKKPLLALSGGLDSSFLTYALAKSNSEAETITATSNFFAKTEIERAQNVSRKYMMKNNLLYLAEKHFALIKKNPSDRCYICKKMIFSEIKKFAHEKNFDVVLDGTTYDDLIKYRPGIKALKELEIKSPLALAKITKSELREIALEKKLEFAHLPSFSCFATRFPYHKNISRKEIFKIQKGENILKKLGFKQYRIRMHGTIARIEISNNDFFKINQTKIEQIVNQLKPLGFKYITLDLEGFRSGSMDL